MMKYYVAILGLCFCASLKAKVYSFPQTGISFNTKAALFTDQKTGGLRPQNSSYQILAFEFNHTQPNNLMIRALKETWKKAGQKITGEKDIYIAGFWGQEIHTQSKIGGKNSYTKNLVFGDFYKMAQVSFICAQLDTKEICKGSSHITKGISWNYKADQSLKTLTSKIKVPPEYKLYFRVNTKKGPVLMYTPYSQPMSDDSVPSLSFAINKGKLDTDKFLRSFAKSSEMTGIKPNKSNLISKRTKSPILYSWGKRASDNKNYYLSCGSLDYKKKYALMVCATGDQSNYTQLHKSLHYLSSQ